MSRPVWTAGCPFLPSALSYQYSIVSPPLVSYRLFPIVFNQLYLIVSSHSNEWYKSTFSSQPILPYQFLLSSFTDQFPANLKFPRKFTADELHCFPSPVLRESIAQIGSCDGWWDSHFGWWELPLWEVRLCDSSHCCNSIPSHPNRLQPSLTLQPTWNGKCIKTVSVQLWKCNFCSAIVAVAPAALLDLE